jgi:hypothetical protein
MQCEGKGVPELKKRPEDQPLPTKNDSADIQSLVIADIQERRELGRKRYGTALQPFNGRSTDRDLYEELLDALMYQRQRMVEAEASVEVLAKIAYEYLDKELPQTGDEVAWDDLSAEGKQIFIGLIRALRMGAR